MEWIELKKVVDSNFLRSERLREYLTQSFKNIAVLTDYALMEAYKGDTLTSIFRSMEILSEHPKQVFVLKSTQIVCGLRGRSSGLQKRMIDVEQTREFAKFCDHLRAVKKGNTSLERQLLD